MRPLIFIGGIIGILFSVIIYAPLAIIFGMAWIVTLGTALSFLYILAFGQTIITWIVVLIFAVIITNIFAYTLATIGLLGPISAISFGRLSISPLEEFMRGFIIGQTAGLNFGVWALIPLGWTIGLLVSLIGFLAVFPAVSRNIFYQASLGWTSWLRPTSYLVIPLGIVLFLINLPSALLTFGPTAVRIDILTGTIETSGGAVAGIRLFGSTSPAYNLGTFSFLTPSLGGIRTPFGTPGLSAHETGHTLTVSAFGGVFGWINAIDENLPPFNRGATAYGELIPESHFARGSRRFVGVWS